MGWSQTTVLAMGGTAPTWFKILQIPNIPQFQRTHSGGGRGEGTEGCSDFFYFFEFLENHAFWRVCFVIGDVENRKLQTALQLGHVWGPRFTGGLVPPYFISYTLSHYDSYVTQLHFFSEFETSPPYKTHLLYRIRLSAGRILIPHSLFIITRWLLSIFTRDHAHKSPKRRQRPTRRIVWTPK